MHERCLNGDKTMVEMTVSNQHKDAAQVLAELTQRNSELQVRVRMLEAELKERHQAPQRALSVTDVLRMKKETFKFEGTWADAFGEPERKGVWFVWGQSGSGKTTFVMQLCKELSRFGKVAYNSLEEGDGLTMRNMLMTNGMSDVKKNFVLLNAERMSDLGRRLAKRKSPDIVVIDSFQYTEMSFKEYLRFTQVHGDKLLIFISQAEGSRPAGRTARSVMYDASLKIWVEGYRAFSKGRYIGPTGQYTIWEERAKIYWGE